MSIGRVDSVRVMGVVYQVVSQPSLAGDDGELLNGDVEYARLAIRLDSNLPEPLKSRVLMHEIVHVILYQSGHSDHDEDLVRALGYGLVSVMEDNPSLVYELMADDDDPGVADSGVAPFSSARARRRTRPGSARLFTPGLGGGGRFGRIFSPRRAATSRGDEEVRDGDA